MHLTQWKCSENTFGLFLNESSITDTRRSWLNLVSGVAPNSTGCVFFSRRFIVPLSNLDFCCRRLFSPRVLCMRVGN